MQRRNAQKCLGEIISSFILIDFLTQVLKLMRNGRHWVLVVRHGICRHFCSYMSKLSSKVLILGNVVSTCILMPETRIHDCLVDCERKLAHICTRPLM